MLASYLELQRCRLLHKLVNTHKALLRHINSSSKWVKAERKRRTRIVLHIFSLSFMQMRWIYKVRQKQFLAGITCVCVVPSGDNVADNVSSASILCDVLNKKRTNWSTWKTLLTNRFSFLDLTLLTVFRGKFTLAARRHFRPPGETHGRARCLFGCLLVTRKTFLPPLGERTTHTWGGEKSKRHQPPSARSACLQTQLTICVCVCVWSRIHPSARSARWWRDNGAQRH